MAQGKEDALSLRPPWQVSQPRLHCLLWKMDAVAVEDSPALGSALPTASRKAAGMYPLETWGTSQPSP